MGDQCVLVAEVELRHRNVVAKFECLRVDGKALNNIRRQAGHFNEAHVLLEDAVFIQHAYRFAVEDDLDFDVELVVSVDFTEIGVADPACHTVALYFA